MKTFYSAICLTVVSVMLFSCGNKPKQEEKELSVRIDTVQVADADAALQFPARVVSSKDANVSFKLAGTLANVYVKEGDQVAAGQLIAEIDPTDYKIQLSATEAEYANIKADGERVMLMYKDGAVTASNYDKARYGLQQITAKLQNHRNQIGYCKLYAPFSGNVKTVYFHSRETVGAGMPVVALVGDGAPEFEVNLPATTYLHRNKFRSYSATLDVLPGEVLPLRYVNVMNEANTNQLYTLRLRLVTPNSKVAAGMSAWVTINASDSTSLSVRVPTTSIVEDDGKCYVFTYQSATHIAKQVEVNVQKLHTDGTAVVIGALKAGDLVISSGAHFVHDGSRVTPLARISSTNVGGLL